MYFEAITIMCIFLLCFTDRVLFIVSSGFVAILLLVILCIVMYYKKKLQRYIERERENERERERERERVT